MGGVIAVAVMRGALVPYLLFLLLSLGLPLVLIAARLARRMRGRDYTFLAITVLLITPLLVLWASFVTARGVQYFTDGRTLGVGIGYVPLEHLVWLVLQVAVVGSLAYLLWRRLYPGDFE
jgi:lycopene cyclase domain-containing protein